MPVYGAAFKQVRTVTGKFPQKTPQRDVCGAPVGEDTHKDTEFTAVRVDTCQNNKAAWLQRKNELAAAEQEYLRLLSGEGRNVSRLDELRNIIEVRKWQVNQAAGRYIRSHEAVQHISIRDRLNDFMQQHGTVLAAALAPELMGYSELTAIARNCAIQRATDALREALLSWLAKGEKINYSAQDSDILTTIGFRPDAASVDDSREKFTPAQNMIFSRKSAQLASHQSV